MSFDLIVDLLLTNDIECGTIDIVGQLIETVFTKILGAKMGHNNEAKFMAKLADDWNAETHSDFEPTPHKLNGNTVQYMTAGNAKVTIENTTTGNRVTYHVKKSDDGKRFYVSVLVAPDNELSYTFLGTIFVDNMRFFHGKKSRISRDAQSARVFAWAWSKIQKGTLPPQVEVHHSGYCGRCGRPLTVPESIRAGIGPICITKI